jgi:EAL and modified HD-GYP domain-containing signal transduction protein
MNEIWGFPMKGVFRGMITRHMAPMMMNTPKAITGKNQSEFPGLYMFACLFLSKMLVPLNERFFHISYNKPRSIRIVEIEFSWRLKMDAFVARQPIFDRKKNLWGYEILYRSSPDASRAYIRDPDEASFSVLHNLLMVMDFRELVRNTRGFINFSKNLLVEDIATLLPVENTVIEILEDTLPDKLTIDACKHLKDKGYLLAVDDFTLEDDHLQPFALIADIIKVDCIKSPRDQWGDIVNRYASANKLLLAEKIETHDDFKYALDQGFDLFQGFFFSRPAVVANKDVPPSSANVIKLMSEIFSKEELSLEDFERILKKDPGMTYKLLRYINSPAVGLRMEVKDIRRAIMLLGEKELRRWFLLVLYGQVCKDNPFKIFGHALHRGRYLELLAKETGYIYTGEVFFMGIISTLDVILQRPIDDIMKQLPVSSEIRNALLHYEGDLGVLYKLVLCHEQDRWDELLTFSEKLNLNVGRLSELYLEALRWAQEVE